MKTLILPSGRTTSRLGFGGTVLKGGSGRDANLALLRAAFDQGLRHYDVAPSYGLGVAEGILADFIKEVRQDVTVTTKVGLPRPKNPGALAQMRAMVRPLVSFSPALRRYLGRSVQKMSGSARTHFEMGHVRASVEESLRELKTDYVDVLLLHEITPREVTDELRQYLDDLVVRGTVLTCGIGSYRHEAEATVHACPDLAAIMQTSWTVGDAPLQLAPHKPFTITHGAVRTMPALAGWLAADPVRRAQIAQQIDMDLEDPAVLGDLMMAAALGQNPDGIVLVSSTKPQRLARHASIAADESLIAKGISFNLAVSAAKAAGAD